MKKYILAIGLVAFLMTSCCDKKENKEAKDCCKGKQEQCDKHHECDHHQAPCPEMMEHIDLMINALANWNDLDEAQRADLIEMAKKHVEMTEAMKAECQKQHEGCCKHEGKCEKHEGCQKHEGCGKHEEGHKCEGNHEGCEHQHKGCQHGDK
ncbi:MAG: hypothetical protein J5708_03955 [Bacteroidales bacterium]|nr:hypothetical protein [Bacteroidales bacterium]